MELYTYSKQSIQMREMVVVGLLQGLPSMEWPLFRVGSQLKSLNEGWQRRQCFIEACDNLNGFLEQR